MANRQQNLRNYRIAKIESSIKQAKEKNMIIDINKLIAIICLDEGCSRRTAQDYIRTLIDSGRITL